jgi:hypothetical protein
LLKVESQLGIEMLFCDFSSEEALIPAHVVNLSYQPSAFSPRLSAFRNQYRAADNPASWFAKLLRTRRKTGVPPAGRKIRLLTD